MRVKYHKFSELDIGGRETCLKILVSSYSPWSKQVVAILSIMQQRFLPPNKSMQQHFQTAIRVSSNTLKQR